MAGESVGIRVNSTDKHPEFWQELDKQYPRLAQALKTHKASIIPKSSLDQLRGVAGYNGGESGEDFPFATVEQGTPDYAALSAAPHSNFAGLK